MHCKASIAAATGAKYVVAPRRLVLNIATPLTLRLGFPLIPQYFCIFMPSDLRVDLLFKLDMLGLPLTKHRMPVVYKPDCVS
jgi:hypothetical protein